jgi:hypothetical protein
MEKITQSGSSQIVCVLSAKLLNRLSIVERNMRWTVHIVHFTGMRCVFKTGENERKQHLGAVVNTVAGIHVPLKTGNIDYLSPYKLISSTKLFSVVRYAETVKCENLFIHIGVTMI